MSKQDNLQVFFCCFILMVVYSQGQEFNRFVQDLDFSNEDLQEVINAQQLNEEVDTDKAADAIDVNEGDVISRVAQSMQDFAFDIFNAARSEADDEENSVLSPLSIYTTLAMLKPGLTGSSLSQIEDVMNLYAVNESDLSVMYESIYKKDPLYQLRHANRIYVDKSVKLTKDYKRDIKKLTVAQARRSNFRRKPEASRTKMNKYVRNRTQKLIDEFVPVGVISSNTRLYLINALYLKASWNFHFSKEMTKTRHFHVNTENTILVPTMQAKNIFCSLHGDESLQADIIILTLGESLSMIITMPRNPGNFTTFYNNNNESMKSKFSRLFQEIWPASNNGRRKLKRCSVALPKFKITSEMELTPSLKLLGLNDVFDPNYADLSRLTHKVENLYVKDVRHKAVLEANESGIHAAAATSITLDFRSTTEGTKVEINKPFTFAVRHDNTGVILFLGKVMRPVT